MENLEAKDGYQSADYWFSHEKVGTIRITQIWYDHSKDLGTEISIYKGSDTAPPRVELFNGSLKELIVRLEK